MKSTTTATIRTAVPTIWTTAVVWLIARLGLNISDDDWQIVFLVLPIIAGVVYRAGREIEGRLPTVGRVLFGSSLTPSYGESVNSESVPPSD